MKKEKKEGKKEINHNFEFLKFKHPISNLPKTAGEIAADKLTKWAGSWTFIIGFLILLGLWMVLNVSWILFGQVWDPYPFILLNLTLSCIAALQAPIILMSQNRENQRDRARAQYDYAVNRKAEREIQAIKQQLDNIEKKLIKK